MQTCPNCDRTDLADSARVCGYCGTRLGITVSAPEPVAPAPAPVAPEPAVPAPARVAPEPVVPVPAPAADRAAPRRSVLAPASGIAFVVIAAFMPWFNGFGYPMDDVSIMYLWDPRSSASNPPFGLVLFAVAALAGFGLLRGPRGAIRAAGVLGIVVCVDFLVQANRVVPLSFTEIVDALDLGWWIALVGSGVLTVWAWRAPTE